MGLVGVPVAAVKGLIRSAGGTAVEEVRHHVHCKTATERHCMFRCAAAAFRLLTCQSSTSECFPVSLTHMILFFFMCNLPGPFALQSTH